MIASEKGNTMRYFLLLLLGAAVTRFWLRQISIQTVSGIRLSRTALEDM